MSWPKWIERERKKEGLEQGNTRYRVKSFLGPTGQSIPKTENVCSCEDVENESK